MSQEKWRNEDLGLGRIAFPGITHPTTLGPSDLWTEVRGHDVPSGWALWEVWE